MDNYVLCKVCGDRISVDTDYEFVSCSCGAIAVDGGQHYCRIIGNTNNYEVITKEDERWRPLNEVLAENPNAN